MVHTKIRSQVEIARKIVGNRGYTAKKAASQARRD
jgi:hypothetical protein